MSGSPCTVCPSLEILQWHQGDYWEKSQVRPEELISQPTGDPAPISNDTQLAVMIASATKMRECPSLRCRQALSQFLQMRESWWSGHYKKSNGYFGRETTRDAAGITSFNTWSFFEVKQLQRDMFYYWDKLNVFTRWKPSTNQTIVVLFDLKTSILDMITRSLLNFDLTLPGDPYWAYPTILKTVSNLQEYAVWLIRDQVRGIEKSFIVSEKDPIPQYRKFSDIGRHTIHVGETLDVAVQTIESIQRQHLKFLESQPGGIDLAIDHFVGAELEFHRNFIANLRHRSTSNEKRLSNEYQLIFNTVAQQNAHAAKIDSSAMKTIAFVTLIFLPPTFISSVFSMSFFQCGEDNAWGVSSKFWLYWVFAIPITVATGVVWQYWHNLEKR